MGSTFNYFATSSNARVNGAVFTVDDLTNGGFRLTITATGPNSFIATRTYDFYDDGANVSLLSRGISFGAVPAEINSPTLLLTPSTVSAGSYSDIAPAAMNLGVFGFGTGSVSARTVCSGTQSVATPLGVFDANRLSISLQTQLNVTYDPGTAVTSNGVYNDNERLTLWVVPGIGVVRASISTTSSTPFITDPPIGLPVANANTTYTASLSSFTLGS